MHSKALRLVTSKRKTKIWGWKDPRTTLFLNMWDKILDNPRYIFVYRSPFFVIDSLFRRKTDKWLMINPFLAAISWINYNKRIIDFYEKQENNCVIINLDDFIKNTTSIFNIISEKLNIKLNLDKQKYNNIFDEKLLKNREIYCKRTNLVSGLYLKDIIEINEKLNKYRVLS